MFNQSTLTFLLPNMKGGGTERVALALIHAALAEGHAVDLLLMDAVGDLLHLVPGGARIIDLRAPRIRDVVKPLRRYLKESQPRSLQAFMWPLTVAAVIAHCTTKTDARLVLSDHSTLSVQYADLSGIAKAFLRYSIRLTYPLADARVCVSKGAATDLAALSGLDYGSIEVIYNPVPPAFVAPSGIDLAQTIWPSDGARIIAVGSLKAQKNFALLLSAFAGLLSRRPAHLVILGEGTLRGDLEDQVHRLGLSDNVVLAGFKVDPAPYYATADVFALSSDYEGFGLVIVEAMHAGLTVVSTDCKSGPREILEDGLHGYLVPCRDETALALALEEALDHPKDPAAVRRRAAALIGEDSAQRYIRLMGGDAASHSNRRRWRLSARLGAERHPLIPVD